jgi:hypothetical protein
MTVTLIEGIAVFLMYLLGGALVLFIYEAFLKTRQKSLLFMAGGFFILIFGSNLNTLVEAVQTMGWAVAVDGSTARTASLAIQLMGILLLLYSARGPFRQKD